MSEQDAIIVAAFEDSSPSSAAPNPAAPRPPGRPRPVPSTISPASPLSVPVGDDDLPPARPAAVSVGRPILEYDLGLYDTESTDFLVVYAAGTPLNCLKPRTVSVSAADGGPPVTALTLYARSPADPRPIAYRTLKCPEGFGSQLTLRLVDPADPRSVVVDRELTRANRSIGNGTPEADG